MEQLPHEVRAFIVRRLACYESAGEVKAAVKEVFGLDISTSRINYYNPENGKADLAKEWVDLFYETREKFQMGLDDVGIVWRAYRLKRLDEMERNARMGGMYELAAKLLEQAAKEVGGSFEKQKAGITLDVLQKSIDELAQAVAAEVRDPEVLKRIEERWGKISTAAGA
jgi:hypothetical protein